MTVIQPDALFAEISAFVADSREMLQQGMLMELGGLDRRVQHLCELVMHLSDEERARYADKLQQVLGDLTTLGAELTEKRDAIAEEVLGLPGHKKASTAYRSADAVDDFGKKKPE